MLLVGKKDVEASPRVFWTLQKLPSKSDLPGLLNVEPVRFEPTCRDLDSGAKSMVLDPVIPRLVAVGVHLRKCRNSLSKVPRLLYA